MRIQGLKICFFASCEQELRNEDLLLAVYGGAAEGLLIYSLSGTPQCIRRYISTHAINQ